MLKKLSLRSAKVEMLKTNEQDNLKTLDEIKLKGGGDDDRASFR